MRRRQFLSTLAATAAASTFTARSYAQVAGANNRVRLALIGCGSRGKGVAADMAKVEGVQYVAYCDLYDVNAGQAKESAWGKSQGDVVADFRRVLDRNDVDAVHVATPDHWHAIPAYLACLAGKDAYVEKPLTHNIAEGRALVNVAREKNRVVQTGTQHRSAPHYAEVTQMVKEGMLGEIRFVRIWNYMNKTRPVLFGTGGGRGGRGGNLDQKPESLDWDFYCGPAPLVPYERPRFLATFRGYYEYAGGYVADYGAHRFDSMRQMLGEADPISASAFGGRYLNDPGNTPDVISAVVQFPGFTMSYEGIQTSGHGVGGRTPGMRYYRANGEDDRPNGVALYGSRATVIIDRIGYDVYPETNTAAPRGRAARAEFERENVEIPKYVAGTPERKSVQSADRTDLHTANFIECIRSRNKPNADVEIGHRSCIIPHLINIAYRSNSQVQWDPATETIAHNVAASELITRKAREPWAIVPGT